MTNYKLGEMELRFALIIWERQPVASSTLVKLCEKELAWKKPTTYTVLRKLCQKGFFKNQDAVVTALISKEEYDSRLSREFVKEAFQGSLPKFLTAFTGRSKLSKKEIDEIQSLIDDYKEV